MSYSSRETAREVLEVVPLIMRTVRTEMRGSSAHDLSVPQFRTLGFVHRHPGTSLSDVAEHIGLTLPSMSKLIDGLVERKLIVRESRANDRRCITLALTARGRTLLDCAHESTQMSLAERLSALRDSERATVVRSMRMLHPLFARAKTEDGGDHSGKHESKIL